MQAIKYHKLMKNFKYSELLKVNNPTLLSAIDEANGKLPICYRNDVRSYIVKDTDQEVVHVDSFTNYKRERKTKYERKVKKGAIKLTLGQDREGQQEVYLINK